MPQIIRRHALRNALLPVITFAGIQLGQMAGGAVLTETVFGWPGIGRLMFDALVQRDYQLLLGVFLITSTMVVVFNLITDLIYRFIDPRIQGKLIHESLLKDSAPTAARRAGLAVLLAVIVVGALAPLLYEESPWMMVGPPLLAPFTDPAFPLGTDMLGRDIAAGLIYGARVSLLIGVISTAVAVFIGILVGASAATSAAGWTIS